MMKLKEDCGSSVRISLHHMASAILAHPGVCGLYIGGSCAKGDDDLVSDIDLWVKASSWSPASLSGLLIAGRTSKLGELDFFHGVDRYGTVVDIIVGREPWTNYIPVEVDPAEHTPSEEGLLSDFFADFWISSYKHRKPLYRHLSSMICIGLHHDRMSLLRAWAKSDTGIDPGEGVFTIHGLTPIINNFVEGRRDRENLLGLPTQTLPEKIHAIEAYRSEMIKLMPSTNALTDIVCGDPIFGSMKEAYRQHVGRDFAPKALIDDIGPEPFPLG